MNTTETDYAAIVKRLRAWASGDTCDDCAAHDDTAFLAADAIEQLLQENEDLLDVSAEALGAMMRKVARLEHDLQAAQAEIILLQNNPELLKLARKEQSDD